MVEKKKQNKIRISRYLEEGKYRFSSKPKAYGVDEDGNFYLIHKKYKKHTGAFTSGETIHEKAKLIIDGSSKTKEDIDPLKSLEDTKLYKPRVLGKDYYSEVNYKKVPKVRAGTGFRGSRKIGKTMKVWLDNEKTKFKIIKTSNPEIVDKKSPYERESAGVLRAMDNYGRGDNKIKYTPLEERKLPKSPFKIRHVSKLLRGEEDLISRTRYINGFITSTQLSFNKPFPIKQGIWVMIHFRIFPLSNDKEVKKKYTTHYYWVRENNIERIRKKFREELTSNDLHGVHIQITNFDSNDPFRNRHLWDNIFPAKLKKRSDFYGSVILKFRNFLDLSYEK